MSRPAFPTTRADDTGPHPRGLTPEAGLAIAFLGGFAGLTGAIFGLMGNGTPWLALAIYLVVGPAVTVLWALLLAWVSGRLRLRALPAPAWRERHV